jgi:hypothetical protein
MAPKESDVPQPGPARLSKGAGPDEWLEQAKTCKYLPEADMKRLCEIVKECLMEGAFGYTHANLELSTALAYGEEHALTQLPRIQYPACTDASHSVRRYPRPVL